MAVIRPFKALHPAAGRFAEVSALPYDVYSRAEAREAVKDKPYSFLNIDRPETQFDPAQDMYAPEVYEKAAEMLRSQEAEGIYEEDGKACFYIYEQTMDGRAQTGLVAASSVDDYESGVIRKHENTRREKEEDRIRHVDVTSAQTGPIFLAYRASREISNLLAEQKESEPMFDFTSEDGVRHRGWRIDDDDRIRTLTELFSRIPNTYIADGHHRAASAVAVSKARRAAHPEYTGKEEYNFFLSVLFPDEELAILDYNRVLKDLNGKTKEEILEEIGAVCAVEAAGEEAFRPREKGVFGLLLDGNWYCLKAKAERCLDDPVGSLDAAFLQREILAPVFGILDPRTDERIDFVGGIRGLAELERRCATDCKAAFALYPTSIAELFAVADAGLLMPPKSTWFEPKLRSGLFIHKIEKQ